MDKRKVLCLTCDKVCKSRKFPCDKCYQAWYCSTACSGSTKAKSHAHTCNRVTSSPEYRHANRFQPRFKVGDRVLYRDTGTWVDAFILEHWSREHLGYAVYRVKLTVSGDSYCSYTDDDRTVRSYSEPGLPRLLQAVRCKDGVAACMQLVQQFSIDLSLVGRVVLLETAVGGNIAMFHCLVEQHGIDPATTDQAGRNVLHLALLFKQFGFVEMVRERHKALIRALDSKSQNVMHYLVLSKNTELLSEVLGGGCFDIVDGENDAQGSDRKNHLPILNWIHPARLPAGVVSPLELARRTQQPQMAQIVDVALKKAILIELMKLVTAFDYHQSSVEDFIACFKILEGVGLDDRYFFVHSEASFRSFYLTSACVSGNLPILRWLLEQHRLGDDELAGIRDRHGQGLLQAAVRGPGMPANVAQVIEERQYDCTQGINTVLREWDGQQDVASYLLSRRDPSDTGRYSCMLAPKCGDSYELGVMLSACFVNFVIDSKEGVAVAERLAVIEHLLQRAPSLRPQLSPELFVVHHQPPLLRLVVERGLLGLQAPPSSYPGLVQYMNDQAWSRELGTCIATTMEALFYIAAGLGELYTFMWAEAALSPGVHEVESALYVAVLQGRYGVVRRLCRAGGFNDRDALVRACRLAIQRTDAVIAKFLLEHEGLGWQTLSEEVQDLLLREGSGDDLWLNSWRQGELLARLFQRLCRAMEANDNEEVRRIVARRERF